MKFAICQELFEGWEWERQCAFVAETGYDGIEVAPFSLADSVDDLSDDDLAKLRETAESHGLEIIGLHWLLAKTEGLHLTTSDRKTRQRTAAYLVKLGRICSQLGGTVMVFGSPFQRNLDDGMTMTQGLQNAAEVFREALPQFADDGVEICMEPLTPKETDFITTCAHARHLIDMVDMANFSLHQDVKAMSGAEVKSMPELIAEFSDITHHFHANDINLRGPGMGEIDFEPVFRALNESGYDRYVSVEVFDYSPGAETIAVDSLRYMRDVWSRVTT